MNDTTLDLLLRALAEEVKARALKPEKAPKPAITKPGPWCTREQANAYYALPKGRLEQWVIEGLVIAKKFDREDPNSGIRFRTEDIEATYEAMPDYHFETRRKMHTMKNGVRT